MKSILEGFFMAWGNFSIIPCPYKVWTQEGKRWMLTLMPFVGILIGLINYLVVVLWIHSILMSSFLVLVCVAFLLPHFLTGFIHLDGFMDCCDAILSRRDIETKQRILKDSTVGAFSVICLVSIFLLGIGATYATINFSNPIMNMGIMIFVHFLSRNLASRDVQRLKPMESSQYAHKTDEIQKKGTVRISMVLMILILSIGALLFTSLGYAREYVIVMLAVFIIQKLTRYRAVKSLGGMNGDIAGYSIVVSEIGGLVFLSFL